MLTRILQDLAYFFEIPLHHSKPFLSLKNSGRRSPTNPSSSKVSLAESPSPIGVYPSRAVAYRSLPKSRLQSSRLNKSDITQADVPPPPPPSEDPQPKLPPPNTLETPAAVAMPNPPPAQQPDKTIRGRAKRSRLSTCSPTRRSSRFNKPDTSQADQVYSWHLFFNLDDKKIQGNTTEAIIVVSNLIVGTPVEPSMPAPSKSEPPKQPEATVPMPADPPSEVSGPADPPPNTRETPAAVAMPNPPPAQQPDKTITPRAKRSRLSTCSPTRRSSRFNKPDPSQADQGPPVEPSVAAETVQRDVPPPILQQEVEPDPSMSAPSKSEPPKQPESTVPLHNPLPVAHDLPPPPSEDSQPADPPPNTVIKGRAKRSRSSTCSPTRRSSRFNKPDPSQADQGTPPNSVVQQHDMTERGRGSSTSDSLSKETPNSVPNSPLQPEAGDPKWDDWPESDATQQGESESLFRHKCKMESEKGSSVTLKEVFDRIHTKETHAGKVYVNKKAEEKMALYEDLKENYNARLSDEDLWDIAVDGEDAKGRLFGFGHRSRTCKGNKELAKEDAALSDHAKSTATSAEDESTTFTKSQVVVMIKSQVAAERRRLLADIAAQEARHNTDREEFKKKEEQNKKLFAELFKRTGAPLTTFHGGSSKGNDGGGASGGGRGRRSTAVT
ncbi:hypothetical protein FCM35_KLT11343 [Carex littledalei]|uniref:Uncharacterized protein n=1 Tax=Carex littledalei TaxID=544730 RepID=A0A833V3D9_9POAL|nr:hypothetical protein FCM35_KLT11343 [Carex littledalei]